MCNKNLVLLSGRLMLSLKPLTTTLSTLNSPETFFGGNHFIADNVTHDQACTILYNMICDWAPQSCILVFQY